MAGIALEVNGTVRALDINPATPLLWALRDHFGLTGTKFGCGIGECGVCTVLLDGEPVRSCSTTIREADGKKITTIEGLGGRDLHPLQKIWQELEVPQCGYCQPGQLLTAAALLAKNPHPTDDQILDGMGGVLCRCGTYQRILGAVRKAAAGGAR